MNHPDDATHRRSNFIRVHPQHGGGLADAQVLSETQCEHGMILRLERCGHPGRTPSNSIGLVALLVRHDIVPYDAGPSNVPGNLRKRRGRIVRDPAFPLPVESVRFHADEIWDFTVSADLPWFAGPRRPVAGALLAIAASMIATMRNIDTSHLAPRSFALGPSKRTSPTPSTPGGRV